MQHGTGKPDLGQGTRLLSRDGVSYRVMGDAPETIVLVHGVGSSADTWSGLCPLLADSYRLVSYDLRGHGGSLKRPPPWSVDELVSDHLRLMAELRVARYHLVGFSLGSLIAISVAIYAPEAVDKLVLLNCVGDRREEDLARTADRLAQVRSSKMARIAQGSVGRWFTAGFPTSHPDAVQQEVALVSATDEEMYRAAYEVLATSDPIGYIHRVQAPVLLITGEADMGSTPRMSMALANQLSNSSVRVLPGLRHYLHIEAPDAIADIIKGFLSKREERDQAMT
jgi:pimeloyl-ACP methyl ester carboxylesterase